MKDFLGWNDAVAQHFFRPENAGKTVYLYVTSELIEQVGGLDGGIPEFIEVLRKGPPWDAGRGICQNALHAMQGWRARALKFPPYVGYLALFVLAAGFGEREWAPHAYYPRLRALLGEPEGQNYPSFSRMWELWMDLEEWLKERSGEFGILRTDLAGDLASAMVHVNYPVSQAILIEEERVSLHDIFAEADIDPGDPPSDMQLAQAIRAAGSGRLRKRTLRALEAKQRDADYTAVLIDRILEELESWDGEVSARPEEGVHRRGTAVLCVHRDLSAKRVKAELRCHFSEPFPEGVAVMHGGTEFRCRELANGISTALVDPAGNKLDPTSLDWAKPQLFGSPDGKVALRLSASDARVLVDGSYRGLPGYVEVRAFDPSRPFLLAASPKAEGVIRQWGAASCSAFVEHAFTGLPQGWVLFSAAAAADDELIHEHLPQLSFSRKLRRIRIEGGLRVPGTQFYFRFAPPAVRLEGASTAAEVRFNDTIIERDPDGIYSIPEDLLTFDAIAVTCADRGRKLQKTIYLREGGDSPAYDPRAYSRFSEIREGAAEGLPAWGVPIDGRTIHLTPWIRPLADAARATVIGQAPGQIAAANVASGWPPVWRITHHGRRATVEYVAPVLLEPVAAPCGDRRAVRHWKEILWIHRKRIDPPTFLPLRKLWADYQHAAKDA